MLKVIFLFLGVWWTLVNTIRVINRASLPSINILLQAIGITGFIVLQFNLL